MRAPHLVYGKPAPPASSYWCGATREELAQHIAARRAQMDVPTIRDVRYDPAIAATVSLSEAHVYAKMGRERP